MEPQNGLQAQVAELRRAIAAAFGSLPVPQADELTAGNAAAVRDAAQAQQVHAAVAGRHWQSLTPEEATRWWNFFCYFSPPAYRFYLPALLDAALARLGQDDALVHSVVYALNPSYWHIYYRGADQTMATRQSTFSPAQYEAVVRFLGLMFNHSASQGSAAAAALRHVWNARPEQAAYQQAMQWYREQGQWSCPAANAEQRALVRRIETAFAGTACPPLADLCGSAQGDEPAELCLEMAGLAWDAIAPGYLDRNSACLSFMTPVGVCYFLPAYMRADAMGLLQADGPVFRLTHGLSASLAKELADGMAGQPPIDWASHARACFQPLNAAQRGAVVAYLEFARERDKAWNPGQTTTIDEALAGYWLKESAF